MNKIRFFEKLMDVKKTVAIAKSRALEVFEKTNEAAVNYELAHVVQKLHLMLIETKRFIPTALTPIHNGSSIIGLIRNIAYTSSHGVI